MITASIVVAYGAVAGLIGLTYEDYKKSGRPTYLHKIDRAYVVRTSYNAITL